MEAGSRSQGRMVFSNSHQTFNNVMLSSEQHIGPRFVDVHWSGTNLAVADWGQIAQLGDAYEARQTHTYDGTKKRKSVAPERILRSGSSEPPVGYYTVRSGS
jgi:hypothetical protein